MAIKTNTVSILCSKCKGTGVKCDSCEEWQGQRISKFLWNLAARSSSSSTTFLYMRELKYYAKYLGLDYVDKIVTNPEYTKAAMITTYITKDVIGRRNAGPSAQNNAISAIFRLCYVNHIRIEDKEFVTGIISEKIEEDDEEEDETLPYWLSEVQALNALCGDDLCHDAVTALLPSNGMRIGGIYEKYAPTYTVIRGKKYSDNYLRIRDFEPAMEEIQENEELMKKFVEKCADLDVDPRVAENMFKINVYRHSVKKDRYWTYTTPETTLKIKKHWQSRIDAGEPTGPDGKLLSTAPAFRNRFGTQKSRLKDKSKRDLMEKIRIDNIKTPRPLTDTGSELYLIPRRKRLNEQGKMRLETTVHHSYRRFFETEMKDQRNDGFMSPEYVSLLKGSKPEGMAKHYHKPGPEKLLPVYMKYMYRVMVDQSQVLKTEVKELKTSHAGRIERLEQGFAQVGYAVTRILEMGEEDRRRSLAEREQQDYIPIEPTKPALEDKAKTKAEMIRKLQEQQAELTRQLEELKRDEQ